MALVHKECEGNASGTFAVTGGTPSVVDCPPEAVRIGMPVEVVFEDATPAVTLPESRPA